MIRDSCNAGPFVDKETGEQAFTVLPCDRLVVAIHRFRNFGRRKGSLQLEAAYRKVEGVFVLKKRMVSLWVGEGKRLDFKFCPFCGVSLSEEAVPHEKEVAS